MVRRRGGSPTGGQKQGGKAQEDAGSGSRPEDLMLIAQSSIRLRIGFHIDVLRERIGMLKFPTGYSLPDQLTPASP